MLSLMYTESWIDEVMNIFFSKNILERYHSAAIYDSGMHASQPQPHTANILVRSAKWLSSVISEYTLTGSRGTHAKYENLVHDYTA